MQCHNFLSYLDGWASCAVHAIGAIYRRYTTVCVFLRVYCNSFTTSCSSVMQFRCFIAIFIRCCQLKDATLHLLPVRNCLEMKITWKSYLTLKHPLTFRRERKYGQSCMVQVYEKCRSHYPGLPKTSALNNDHTREKSFVKYGIRCFVDIIYRKSHFVDIVANVFIQKYNTLLYHGKEERIWEDVVFPMRCSMRLAGLYFPINAFEFSLTPPTGCRSRWRKNDFIYKSRQQYFITSSRILTRVGPSELLS